MVISWVDNQKITRNRVLKYTHFPEAIDPSHPINRHWFLFRREASVTLQEERQNRSDAVTRLLYGEVDETLSHTLINTDRLKEIY